MSDADKLDRIKATRAANAAPIDFDNVIEDETEFKATGVRGSHWIDRIVDLADGVEAGHGEIGKFYKIGEFTAESGARNTIKAVAKKGDQLTAAGVKVNLQPKSVKGGSELWAAILA